MRSSSTATLRASSNRHGSARLAAVSTSEPTLNVVEYMSRNAAKQIALRSDRDRSTKGRIFVKSASFKRGCVPGGLAFLPLCASTDTPRSTA
jgi:hypothetical protein